MAWGPSFQQVLQRVFKTSPDSIAVCVVADTSAGAITPGFTEQFTGSTTTAAEVIITPASATSVKLVRFTCNFDQPASRRLLYSMDGTTFHSLVPGQTLAWVLYGTVSTVKIKRGTGSDVDYEITINSTAT